MLDNFQGTSGSTSGKVRFGPKWEQNSGRAGGEFIASVLEQNRDAAKSISGFGTNDLLTLAVEAIVVLSLPFFGTEGKPWLLGFGGVG